MTYMLENSLGVYLLTLFDPLNKINNYRRLAKCMFL